MRRPSEIRSLRRRLLPAAVACLLVFGGGAASGQDLQGRLDAKRAELDDAQQRQGVLSTTLERLSGRVDGLTAQVAALRNREAAVRAELERVRAELAAARDDLKIARERLERATRALEDRLVEIYMSEDPDLVAVLLDSEGMDDLLGRSEYLSSIQDRSETVLTQVRELRDQTRATVETISAARDQIVAKKAELASTRSELEARERTLIAVRERQSDALEQTRTRIGALQGDVGHLEKRIQARLRAAQEAAAQEAAEAGGGVAPAAVPAAPSSEQSSSGLIWPVSGTVTSPFGPRWGSVHEGIDIGAAEGTSIQAADSGTVVMAGWNGGYGNYTCIDHGGGFSTCYAHQASISVSVGQNVSQGDVIGAVGNTGNSFGAHLHFETRVNGIAEDPLGYL